MTQQIINLGSGPDTQTGDSLYVAFNKVNDNFTELYGVFDGNGISYINANVIISNSVVVSSNIRTGNIAAYGNIETIGYIVTAGAFYPNGAPIGSLSAVATNIVPIANSIYTIGNQTNQFTQGYFSENLSLAGANVTVVDGLLYVDGQIASGNYGNANVASFLPVYGGNISAVIITANQPYITQLGTIANLEVESATFYGNLNVDGILIVDSNAALFNVDDFSINSAIVKLNTGTNGSILNNDNNFDSGIETYYFDTENKKSFFGRKDSSGYFEYYSNVTSDINNSISGTYGTIKTGNLLLTQDATVTGNISANYFIGNGNLLDNVDADLLDGYNSSVSAQPNTVVVRNNFGDIFSNNISGIIITANQNNITSLGSLTSLNVLGNASANYFLGNGRFLSGIDTTIISNGNSNVRVYSNGNVAISVNAAPNVAVITSVGGNITGDFSVTGTISAANIVGNVTGNVIALGSNTEIIFNDGNILNSSSGFTFDKSTNSVIIAGNLTTNGQANLSNLFVLDNTINSQLDNIVIQSNSTVFIGQDTNPNHLIVSGNILTSSNLIVANAVVIDSNGNVVTAQLQDSGVNADTYGNSSAVPVITVDIKGRITSASTTPVAGVNNVTYDSNLSNLTVFTSAGTNFSVDLNVGTSDSPSFSNLLVTGNIVSTNIQATNVIIADEINARIIGNTNAALVGTLSTSLQPNISTVGNLTNLTVIGSTEIGSTLTVTANATINALTVNNSATFGSNLSATGNVLAGNIRSLGVVLITDTTNSIGANTGALIVQGGASFEKDVHVLGNIFATNIVAINANTLSVQDPLLYLTANAPFPYNYDIGVYSQFDDTGSNYQHTGLVRDVDDGVWKFFSNVIPEPTITIDFNNAIYDRIQTGGITSLGSIIGNSSISIFGNATLGNLTVNGSSVIGTTLQVQGGIQNTPIGNVTPNSAQFTTINSSGNVTVAALTVNTSIIAGTTLSAEGGIQNTPIGNVTPSSAQFTSLVTSGNTTINELTVNANANIGASLFVAGNISALNFIGNVIGNISGNIASPGANTQVLFNDNGAIAADSGLTFNNSTDVLTVLGNIVSAGFTTTGSASLSSTLQAQGGIQNTPIGNVTPDSAQFTSVSASGNAIANGLTVNSSATVGSTLGVIGNVTVDSGNLFVQRFNSTSTQLSAPVPGSDTGFRVTLRDFNTTNQVNYGIGVEGNHIWHAVDNNIDALGFKWYGNTTQVARLSGAGNFTIIGNLIASGAGFSNAVNINGNITVGNLTSNSSITAISTLSAAGGIQNTPIGNVTPNAAQFTTINASGNVTVSNLTVNNSSVFGSNLTVSGALTVTDSTPSTSNVTGAIKVTGGVGIGENVYVGNRVGWVAANSVSAVYQIYNSVTNSLDTVFG